MNENRYYRVRVEGAKYGVSFGSALAIAIYAHDPALNQGILEPSIGLRKRDSITGGWTDNSAIPGEWVAVSVTLPLRKPCLVSPNAVAGRVSLPGPLCVYDKHMTKRERAQRDART